MVETTSVGRANSKLRIVYTTNGEEFTKYISHGQKLSLTQSSPESRLVLKNEKVDWVTPYPGIMAYQTSKGKTKKAKVKSVPESIAITTPWQVNFSNKAGLEKQVSFDELIDWSKSDDEAIRYFSGTATYSNEFTVSKKLLRRGNALELDLGSVSIIAEVKINGKDLGILWRAPFRINLDGVLKDGVNTLEVKVTNLWPNRLIGDARIPADFKRRGANIKQWPEWIKNPSERPSERTTLTAFRHWNKNAELLPSGLLGPVIIRPYVKVVVKK